MSCRCPWCWTRLCVNPGYEDSGTDACPGTRTTLLHLQKNLAHWRQIFKGWWSSGQICTVIGSWKEESNQAPRKFTGDWSCDSHVRVIINANAEKASKLIRNPKFVSFSSHTRRGAHIYDEKSQKSMDWFQNCRRLVLNVFLKVAFAYYFF